MAVTLILYSREYCSLCQMMLEELIEWQTRHTFDLQVVDVDADPELEKHYDELVPVLMAEDSEICHWHLDVNALAAYLDKIS